MTCANFFLYYWGILYIRWFVTEFVLKIHFCWKLANYDSLTVCQNYQLCHYKFFQVDYSSNGVAGWRLVYLVKLHRAKLYRFSKSVWSETLSETFFHYMCIKDTRRSLHKLLCQNLLEIFPSFCCGNAALSLSICFGYIWDITRMSSLKHKT